MERREKNNFISIVFTICIIALLIFSAPITAVVVNVSSDKTSYSSLDTSVTFTAYVDINWTGERIPIQNLTLKIKNSTGIVIDTCTFDPSGNNLTSCENITNIITIDSTPCGYGNATMWGYGYGYDYNNSWGIKNTSFGYGYGYGYSNNASCPIELKYNITWNLTKANPPDGNYTADLEALAQNNNTVFLYTSTSTTKASFYVDRTAPTITNVTSTVTTTTAVINWITSEPANSSVLYGTNSSNLSSNATNSSLITNHSIALGNLSASTTYYYNVSSCDSYGNCNTTGIYTFTTLSVAPSPGIVSNVTCIENWICTEWSACIDGVQTRTCTDQNKCGTEENKPAESQSCVASVCGNGICETGETTENCPADCPAVPTAPEKICEPAAKRCFVNVIQQCNEEGTEWVNVEDCGARGLLCNRKTFTCTAPPLVSPLGAFFGPGAEIYWGGLVAAIAIIVLLLIAKFKILPRRSSFE